MLVVPAQISIRTLFRESLPLIATRLKERIRGCFLDKMHDLNDG